MAAAAPDLMEALESGALDLPSFRHADHVHAAFLFMSRLPPQEALPRFSAALRRLAAAAGRPEAYHETVTWAYLLLVGERLARGPARDWHEFRAANGDLLAWRPSVLERYYRPETLASDLALRRFVLPDRVMP